MGPLSSSLAGLSAAFRPSLSWSIPAASSILVGGQVREYHVRHTYEVNQNAKKGLTDASFELRKLLREDKVNFTGRERRIKPTQERKMQEEKNIYQIEKRARKQIIKYIMSKIEARKKAKGQ